MSITITYKDKLNDSSNRLDQFPVPQGRTEESLPTITLEFSGNFAIVKSYDGEMTDATIIPLSFIKMISY